MSATQGLAPKRKRITKACDFCHRRGRKCRKEDDSDECLTCVTHGVPCTWDRVPAKRGVKPRDISLSNPQWALKEDRHGSRAVLQVLIDVFFDDVYPIVCTVHEANFRGQWAAGHIPNGQASYARLLAMCALSAQRITSGASTVPSDVANSIFLQAYLDDALNAITGNFQDLRDIESLQAVHLLCVTAMEIGHAPLYHQLMGLYHAIIANEGLADEERWPSGISSIEREERRRLFWHMYRLEVHTSLILGHVVRCPELEIAVEYPSDPDVGPNELRGEWEWLTGWNFVTDLYRGLEHLLVHFRSRRRTSCSPQRTALVPSGLLTDSGKAELLLILKTKYEQLPNRFKQAAEMSADVGRNRCVYQTANIICTYQLLKMLSYASGNVTFHDACETVLELVDGISAIPVDFLRSMSLAMVQELSGFGHLLSSFIGKDLSMADYQHLSKVMICISELLECLISSIPAAAEAAQKLKEYVVNIDSHLREAESTSSNSRPIRNNVDVDMTTGVTEVPFPIDFLEQAPWSGLFTQSLDQQ